MKLIPAIRETFNDRRSMRHLAIMLAYIAAGILTNAYMHTDNLTIKLVLIPLSWLAIGIGSHLFLVHERRAFAEYTKYLEGAIREDDDPDTIRDYADISALLSARLYEEAALRKLRDTK